MRYGAAILQATGKGQGLSPEKLNAKVILNTLIVHQDLVEFPNVLIGFRLKKPSAANEALIKMEMFLNVALEAVPKLKGHLNRETIGDDEFLVLRVDGKMIPWEKLPRNEIKQLVDNEADLDKLIEHVKKMEFVFAMGVREKDLLISLGSSLDCIKNLGSKHRLIDLPEFKPLEKFADKRLTSIGYVSKDFMEQVNNNAKTIDDLRDFLDQMIPMAHFSEGQNSQLTKDVGALAVDLKNMLPKLGAIMGFDFMTDNGYEGYQYNWGSNPHLDGSKPLGLLSHMDGNPILGIVGRRKVSVEDYDNIVKWGKVGWNYMEELALPRLPEENRAKVQAFLTDLKPLLARLDTATRDMWLPAVADGQIGLVVDAKLKSKQIQRVVAHAATRNALYRAGIGVGREQRRLVEKGNRRIPRRVQRPDRPGRQTKRRAPEHIKAHIRTLQMARGQSRSKSPAVLYTRIRCRINGGWIKTSSPTPGSPITWP